MRTLFKHHPLLWLLLLLTTLACLAAPAFAEKTALGGLAAETGIALGENAPESLAGVEENGLGVWPEAVEYSVAAKSAEAAAARDALSDSLAPLKGKAPATVTGGYNVRTGEVAARACGGGKCAEDHVLDALGGNKAEVRFTEAVRPRTGEQVPVCLRCEASYGRDSFPAGTLFKSDQ